MQMYPRSCLGDQNNGNCLQTGKLSQFQVESGAQKVLFRVNVSEKKILKIQHFVFNQSGFVVRGDLEGRKRRAKLCRRRKFFNFCRIKNAEVDQFLEKFQDSMHKKKILQLVMDFNSLVAEKYN